MTKKKPFESVLVFDVDEAGATPSVKEFCAAEGQQNRYWVHCSAESSRAKQWLRKQEGVGKLLADAMLVQKVRPRLALQGNSLLLILRVADTLEAAEHEELRSLRIYVDKNRIISTSLYPLPVVEELVKSWKGRSLDEAGVIPLFMELVAQSVKGLEAILEELEERADLFEKQVLDTGADPEEGEVAQFALDALHLRRYLAPQREVLSKLYGCEISWLDATKKQRIREVYERVSRQLDEVDVLRDRAKIIRDQIGSHVAEQVNERLYVFSVIAVIFVPLGFLTGLLGVNVGGIPGADSAIGFPVFCGILFAVTILMVLVFRRIRWL